MAGIQWCASLRFSELPRMPAHSTEGMPEIHRRSGCGPGASVMSR
jgi:hypothetical protein